MSFASNESFRKYVKSFFRFSLEFQREVVSDDKKWMKNDNDFVMHTNKYKTCYKKITFF